MEEKNTPNSNKPANPRKRKVIEIKSDPDSYRDEHPTSEIKQMEVHHHPDVEKKGLKEYILEGLMIFLAVTMGFFAESLREHIGDKKREKQIIMALARDIEKDSVNLHNVIYVYMPTHNLWVDSVNYYVDSLPLRGNERKLTKSIENATNWALYSAPDVSLDILKNSGTFNLIENDKVKAEILKYNGVINEYGKYIEYVISAEHTIDTSSTAIIRRKVNRQLIANVYSSITNGKNANGFITDAQIPADAAFKTYNKIAFIKFDEKLDQVDNLLNDMLGLYQRMLLRDTKLIEVLQAEYNLKEQ